MKEVSKRMYAFGKNDQGRPLRGCETEAGLWMKGPIWVKSSPGRGNQKFKGSLVMTRKQMQLNQNKEVNEVCVESMSTPQCSDHKPWRLW